MVLALGFCLIESISLPFSQDTFLFLEPQCFFHHQNRNFSQLQCFRCFLTSWKESQASHLIHHDRCRSDSRSDRLLQHPPQHCCLCKRQLRGFKSSPLCFIALLRYLKDKRCRTFPLCSDRISCFYAEPLPVFSSFSSLTPFSTA